MPSPRMSHVVVVAVVVVPPDSGTQYRRPDINSFHRRPIEDIMEEEEYEDEWKRWCSRCRAINHAALQSCRNDNAPERDAYCSLSTRSVRVNDVTYDVHSPSTAASHHTYPLSLSWMMRMRMSFLSSYQHLGTQSQRAYHDDGVAFPWIGIEQRQ